MNEQLTRRQAIQLSAGLSAGFAFSNSSAPAADLEPFNRFPRMVHEHFVKQVRAAEQRTLDALAALKTKADAERYVETVRKKIRRSFGPEPKRTPLNARVTKVVERDAYRIENVIFESRPSFPVTANLYIPKGNRFPRPAVVGTCGHSNNGKAETAYQSFSQALARMGYVVLIYDPIGQGERLQYTKEDLTAKFRPGVSEHLLAGNQQFLVGDFFGMWRAWDGIRALDYLLTRKEVDKNHVGVTGNSGGGTMTTWLCGVEPRWTMAAPSCFVTTFRRNMENELPADTEQCPPLSLSQGLDHADFLAAMAPKPVIILAKERDYFDARGAEEAYRRLQHLYGLLGAKENIGFFKGPTTHGYSQENREAMYRWFNRTTRVSNAQREPELVIEKDETLWCTSKGQVAGLKGTRTVFQFTRDKAAALAQQRPQLKGEKLAREITSVLKLGKHGHSVPDHRNLRYPSGRNYPRRYAIAYAVETEPGIHALSYMLTRERWSSRPPQDMKSALLYVSHHSSDAELREDEQLRKLITADAARHCFTCDVRGIGESRPETCGVNSFEKPYGCDYFYAIHGLMLDKPYIGQKTFDVLRMLDWLRGLGVEEVHLAARGWGSLPTTFAAVLSPLVKRVTLWDALPSYQSIAQTEEYKWPLSSFVPNVLSRFDLPDCYRELRQHKQLAVEFKS